MSPPNKDEATLEESKVTSSTSATSNQTTLENLEEFHGNKINSEIVTVDLEEASKDPSNGAQQSSLNIVGVEPYNHQKHQEMARRYIAYALVALIGVLIFLSFSYLFVLPLSSNTKAYVDNLVSILQILFGPLITLAATAIGYYFGSNSKESKPSD